VLQNVDLLVEFDAVLVFVVHLNELEYFLDSVFTLESYFEFVCGQDAIVVDILLEEIQLLVVEDFE